jgi:hypothetical protein
VKRRRRTARARWGSDRAPTSPLSVAVQIDVEPSLGGEVEHAVEERVDLGDM